ncbi:MAG TPA: hypothetical protein VG245_11280, partial [Candidatus Dormibacteraeota bacterium]|nr:hypothetical protein [Candidatus Dormibacteraeota bacterium]
TATSKRVNSLGWVGLSGRISSFAYDPNNVLRVFASPTAGGVYESLDAGGRWHSIGDGLPTQVIGAIAYDAPYHMILAGSGDNSFGGTGISGHGLYYSADDGATWTLAGGLPDLALSFRVVVSPADHTGSTIYAATSKGLFKGHLAGGALSFVNVNLPTGGIGAQTYTVPDPNQGGHQVSCTGNTTTPLCFFANVNTDVVVKGELSTNAPAGAVVAAVGWRAGALPDTDATGATVATCTLGTTANSTCVQAPRNGIYVSPFTADASGACVLNGSALTPKAGATPGDPGTFCFEDETSTAPTTQGFAANSIVGRTALGIAHGAGQTTDAVYALVQDAQKMNGCPDVLDVGVNPTCNGTLTGEAIGTRLDGMYASYDFGASWTKIMDYTQLQSPLGTGSAIGGQVGYKPGIQAWYNLYVEPDPTMTDAANGHPQRLVFGLEEIWENNLAIPSVSGQSPLERQWQTQTSLSWHVIGRYWNACAVGPVGLSAGLLCNPDTSASVATTTTTHPDQHQAMFVPDGHGGVTLFAGNDGGAFTQHVASGADFVNSGWGSGANTGLYSLQPYDAEIAKDGTVVAGLQDNGEELLKPGGHGDMIFGGDGFWTTIDPNNSQNIIEEYTYASQVNLTKDGGQTWTNLTPTSDFFGTQTQCGPATAQFSTVIEQDPTTPGHMVLGCSQIFEGQNVYAGFACADPSCNTVNNPFNVVFDLGTVANPGQAAPAQCMQTTTTQSQCAPFNVPSAVGVQSENIYVGFCGWCDIITGGLPFKNGIATNVGGAQPAAIGTSNGWHFADANCAACGTPNGKLPVRYINSIQMDPHNPRTVYVTLGGYSRRWIPPGSLGDDVSKVGAGHVFVSHDAAHSFTDITGNLPDISANWTLLHNGQLVVATDLGVFIAPDANGTSWTQLGTGLPNAPVFTLRLQPGHPDTMIAATFGRNVWKYNFAGAGVVAAPSPSPSPTAAPLPNTGRSVPPALLLLGILLALMAGAVLATRPRDIILRSRS